MSADDQLLELWPVPGRQQQRLGLYLKHARARIPKRLTWSNFVVSLDGRIAVRDPALGLAGVPKTIANDRDWRLFQELAAQADALLVSGRYVRELAAGTAQDQAPVSNAAAYADLHDWRRSFRDQAQPTIVIISRSLDLGGLPALLQAGRQVVVATAESAPVQRIQALSEQGVDVLIAGGERVEGRALVDALHVRGLMRIYAMAGPQVLQMLVGADVLDRLYLTTVPRILGGEDFDTFYRGPALVPPEDFRLQAQFLDQMAFDSGEGEQLFSVYGRGLQ